MGIVVLGATFVDIKGFPEDNYLPTGRNVGRVEYIHGGVARNVVEDIANVELRPTFVGIVDNTPLGTDVLQKLQRHKVNTDYVLTIRDGNVTFNNCCIRGLDDAVWIHFLMGDEDDNWKRELPTNIRVVGG